jgi:hypothetical protein
MNPTLKTPPTGTAVHDKLERKTRRAAASLFSLQKPVQL